MVRFFRLGNPADPAAACRHVVARQRYRPSLGHAETAPPEERAAPAQFDLLQLHRSMNYLALLRGINVGGKSVIRMIDLRDCLEAAGFTGVRTFIQSGNVLFTGPKGPTAKLALELEKPIEQKFRIQVGVTVFTATEWEAVVRDAPKWWGRKEEWKHNLLALLPGATPAEVMAAAGNLKPEIEMMMPGAGVVYQSVSLPFHGRPASGKIVSHPIYRRFTVRNHNTTLRLAELLRNSQLMT